MDFKSAIVKENLFKAARQFNIKNKKAKHKTSHLKINGPTKLVYLSEKLKPDTYRLFYLTRSFAKENDYKYCWTAFGRVLLQRTDGSKQIYVKDEESLHKLSDGK